VCRTADEQMSAELNCTNNWEVFGEFCQGQKKEKKELVRKSKNDYFYVNE
jgi:hypothetical protein